MHVLLLALHILLSLISFCDASASHTWLARLLEARSPKLALSQSVRWWHDDCRSFEPIPDTFQNIGHWHPSVNQNQTEHTIYVWSYFCMSFVNYIFLMFLPLLTLPIAVIMHLQHVSNLFYAYLIYVMIARLVN